MAVNSKLACRFACSLAMLAACEFALAGTLEEQAGGVRVPKGTILAAHLIRDGRWYLLGSDQVAVVKRILKGEPYRTPPGVSTVSFPPFMNRIVFWEADGDHLVLSEAIEFDDLAAFLIPFQRNYMIATFPGPCKDRDSLADLVSKVKAGKVPPIAREEANSATEKWQKERQAEATPKVHAMRSELLQLPKETIVAGNVIMDGAWYALSAEEISGAGELLKGETYSSPPGVHVDMPILTNRIVLWHDDGGTIAPRDVIEFNDNGSLVYSVKSGYYYSLEHTSQRANLLTIIDSIQKRARKPLGGVKMAASSPDSSTSYRARLFQRRARWWRQ